MSLDSQKLDLMIESQNAIADNQARLMKRFKDIEHQTSGIERRLRGVEQKVDHISTTRR